jgi:hypothetical protein
VWRFAAPIIAAGVVASCGGPEVSSIPLIRTSGSIGNTVKTQKFGDQEREFANLATGTVRASSYIVQPWIATVQGGMSVAHETNIGGVRDTDSQFVSGEVGLGVLPLSQYPTTVTYNRIDSRAGGNVGIDFVRDRITATNRAALPVGITSFSNASYQMVEQFDFGNETSRDVGLTLSKTFQRATVSLGVKHSNSDFRSDVSEDETRTKNGATLSHNYRPRSDLTIQSNATATEIQEDIETRARDRLFLQGISTSHWRPKNSPFSVNGALRTLRDDIRFGGSGSQSNDTETLLASGTVGVNHRIGPQLNANYGLNSTYRTTKRGSGGEIGAVPASSGESLESNLLAGISYLSLAIPLAGFDWRWDSSANTKVSYKKEDTGNVDNVDGTGRLSLGHSVRRTIPVPLIGASRFSASQKGTVARTEEEDFVPTIAHNASLTRSLSKHGISSFVRLSLNDRRDLAGERATAFSFANLQLSRRSNIDFKREWLGSIGAQVSRRETRGEDAITRVTANGRFGYFDRLVFGVENLRFSSELILNAIGLEDVFTNRKKSDRFQDELRSELRNKLEYRIGKLTVSLEGNLFYVNEELGDLSLFKMRRDFGGTF